MTKSQELEIARIKLQQKLNDPRLVEMRATNKDFESLMEERRVLQEELNGLNKQKIQALEEEGGVIAAATFSQESSEHREALDITRRADLGVMVGSFMGRQAQDGAERDAQQAWGLAGNQIPMAMLAEIRAVAAPASGGGTETISGYVFGQGIQGPANIVRPAVPAGTPVYPSVSVSAVAGRPAEGAAHGSSEPTIRGQLLQPARIQAYASISVEDRARYPSLGQALALHLAEAVVRGMDTQALIGDDGFFDSSSGPLTEPTAPGSATTYQEALLMLTAGVDGERAAGLGEVGLIIGAQTFRDFMALAGTNSDESVMERLSRIGRIYVSGAIPAAASNVQDALTVKGSSPAAVQAVWPGLTIEDVYSASGTGSIGFTAVALAAFSVLHPAAYAWQRSNVS